MGCACACCATRRARPARRTSSSICKRCCRARSSPSSRCSIVCSTARGCPRQHPTRPPRCWSTTTSRRWKLAGACATGCEAAGALGVTALGGDLFGSGAIPQLEGTRLHNAELLRATYALSIYEDPDSKVLRRVNYSALDVEELGSVYESLLDYRPVIQAVA